MNFFFSSLLFIFSLLLHSLLTVKSKAITSERLFVQYIEDMDDVQKSPDILRQFEQPNRRKMSDVTSPISLFILRDDGQLAIIAIQNHPRKGI